MRYVGRYATSRSKLVAHLKRKLRERGWQEDGEPDLDALATRFCELGYVNDAAYALSKSLSLASRGYGKRRLNETLRLAGIGEEEAAGAYDLADRRAVEAALHYAERRKIGPFGPPAADSKQRDKGIAAMVRAGHTFALARTIVEWPRDIAVDSNEIADRAGLDLS